MEYFKLKSLDFYQHHNKTMETSQPEIADYLKDLEICKSQDKIKTFYEHCQNQYDGASDAQTNFSHIQEYAANLLKEFLPDDNSAILDVGCGVGDTGTTLKKSGFQSFHGVDPSPKNIQIAKDKNIYSKLYPVFLTHDGRLPCKNDAYDGVISTGTVFDTLSITCAVSEFCRVIKPGGCAVFTFDDNKLDSRELMSALGDAMFQRKLEIGLMEKQYFVQDGVQTSCYCCVVKILAKLYL